MATINCKAQLFNIGSWTILRLPENASAKLPSRGLTMVKGTINNIPFQIPLEPDGKGSHWFKVEKTILKTAKADAGDTVTLAIESTKEWLEPDIPEDIQTALMSSSQAHAVWMNTTPMARWDWIRWIRSTNNPETRKKRIEVAISKLKSGMRRPCCFNRNECTEPSVSKSGLLLELTIKKTSRL